MTPPRGEVATGRGRRVAVVVTAAVLFLAVRIALLLARDPFFDELFTVWLTRKPFGAIFEALRHDSGPPLYYFFVRLVGLQSVISMRVLSLLFAAIAFAIVLASRSLGEGRWLAAVLLALYPPAALFAVDARAYALSALFVAIAAVCIASDRPYAAALALVAAAYSHYYGVLFFPALLAGGGSWKRRVGAGAMAGALFVPGFLLAMSQPREATDWLGQSSSHLAPLLNLSFAGDYPASLSDPPPMVLVIVSLVVLVLALARTPRRALPFAMMTLVPIAAVIVAGLLGRPIYFPMRFESVIAVPLMLWLGTAIGEWRGIVRAVVTVPLAVIGVMSIGTAVRGHLERPLDSYTTAAVVVSEISRGERIVATGYCYLPAAVLHGDRVMAFPAQQGLHPGWRHRATLAEARAAAATLPNAPLLVIAEVGTPELQVLAEARKLVRVYSDERIVVARTISLDVDVTLTTHAAFHH